MTMNKDFSNLKNQPAKAEKVEETTATTEDTEAKVEAEVTQADESVKDEVVETKAEKKVREKAEAKAQKEAKADSEAVDEDTSDDVYFVNSNTKNLSTMVGDFKNGLFIAKNDEEASCIRSTEDFQWGFIQELSKEEFEKLEK